MGKTYAELGMQGESMNYFMICITLAPSQFLYYREYAETLLKFDRLKEAEDYIREAIKLKANNFGNYMCLGRIMFEGRRFT